MSGFDVEKSQVDLLYFGQVLTVTAKIIIKRLQREIGVSNQLR